MSIVGNGRVMKTLVMWLTSGFGGSFLGLSIQLQWRSSKPPEPIFLLDLAIWALVFSVYVAVAILHDDLSDKQKGTKKGAP